MDQHRLRDTDGLPCLLVDVVSLDRVQLHEDVPGPLPEVNFMVPAIPAEQIRDSLLP